MALGAAAGTLLTVVAEVEDGVALIARAAELNPNLAWVWNYSAYARLFVGEPAAALEHASRAIRLSPHDPQLFGIQTATALAHFFLGDDREALAWAEIAVRQQPNFLIGTCVVAASGALAGNVAAATAAIKRLRQSTRRCGWATSRTCCPSAGRWISPDGPTACSRPGCRSDGRQRG